MKPILRLLFTLALLAGMSSLNAQVTARGSDSTIHVLKALAAGFEKETGKSVRLEGGGSGAGAKAAIAGEVQLAFLSRALSPQRRQGEPPAFAGAPLGSCGPRRPPVDRD